MNTIDFVDINGKTVTVDRMAVYQALSRIPGNFIFGMSLETILEFRRQYLYRRGALPITVESVKALLEKPTGES